MVDHMTKKNPELSAENPLKFTKATQAFEKTPGSARARPDAPLTPQDMETKLNEGLVWGIWGHKFMHDQVAAAELLNDGLIPCFGIRLPEGSNREVVNVDACN